MKNKKVILSSMLAVICCVCLITGATYALFTSQSNANIAIGSGKVDVTATIDGASIETYSGQWNEATSSYDSVKQEGTKFTNGGSAALNADGTALTLDKMTPTDKAVFAVKIVNESNVAIAYRVSVKSAEDTGLFDGLEVRVADDKDALAAVKPIVSASGAWTDWAVGGETTKTVYVEVLLPETAGNWFADKSCAIAVTVEAVQGNAAVQGDATVVEKAVVSTEQEFAAAAASAEIIMLDQDVTNTAPITLGRQVKAIYGNGKKIDGAPVHMPSGFEGEMLLADVNFAAPVNANNNASSFYAASLKGKLTISGCTFADTQWDAIQIIPLDGAEVVIADNTFITTAQGKDHQRYVHVEAASEKIEGVEYAKYRDFSVTLTGNRFYNCDRITNAVIDVDNVIHPEKITFGQNKLYGVTVTADSLDGVLWMKLENNLNMNVNDATMDHYNALIGEEIKALAPKAA